MSSVKLCMHTKVNGKRCRGVALRGKSYCRFHDRYYERRSVTEPDYEPPVFEDSRSLLMGIHELVRSRIKGKIDNRDLTSCMYAYQVAASTLSRPDAMAPDVAEPFERAAREKAIAKSGGSKRRVEKPPEEAKDDPDMAEVLLDTYNELSEQGRRKEAEEQGLPAPEPLPIDRHRIRQEFFEMNPHTREAFEPIFRDVRRFPGDPWPQKVEEVEADDSDRPLIDEGNNEGEDEPALVSSPDKAE